MNVQQAADQAQRDAALDPSRSFIVQAPAGSGKTELLIQRFLVLLARVTRPQQVLAITFTRKAAAEMRQRLLDALCAARGDQPLEPHRQKTWKLARAVLEQDTRQDWKLLENPTQLSIQTIDSLNGGLVRKMPWLSRLGGFPQLAEDAEPLYRKASERLLQRLGSGEAGDIQLQRLLAHIDNRVGRLQQMLVAMLAKRDQWLRHLYELSTADPCVSLEASLGRLIERRLADLAHLTPQRLVAQILSCGRIAAQNLAAQERPLLYLTDLDWWPDARLDHLAVWQGLADLLLTAKGELRSPRGVSARCGFPATDRESSQLMKDLLGALEEFPQFIDALAASRALPAAQYPTDQRLVLKGLIELLPLLVAELWLEFRRSGQADFAEIAQMAKEALGSADDPGELLLQIDYRLEHLLVDEFQDTSRLQYGLLELLTSGWEPGDGRSLFLVGDPMQSIYLFREAEVGLYLKTFQGRLGEQGPLLEPLQLSCNFRSQQGLVDWVNHSFSRIFPTRTDLAAGAVPHALASAFRPKLDMPAVTLKAFDAYRPLAEAEAVVERIEQIRTAQPDASVAILVRSRNHLSSILAQLRSQGIRYQAQDIDQLGARPAALDLLALYRALTCRADRLAWLSVLRAPWCGLELSDLDTLCRGNQETLPAVLADSARLAELSSSGAERLRRCWPVLEKALARRGRVDLRKLLEGCWLSLGGPACYEADGVNDALLVLDLVESLQRGTELADPDQLERELGRLFAAPDTSADGLLQVMTIHKAKGLEFDHVLLPGLGRVPAGNDAPLLRWLEHPEVGLLLAPIAARDGSDQDPIYRLIGQLIQQKQNYEATRLLYVAATRARDQLHLFGHARMNSRAELMPATGSLLAELWPVCAVDFCAAVEARPEPVAVQASLLLKRLPAGWSLPQFAAVPAGIGEATAAAETAAEKGARDQIFSGWEQQVNRHVGTLVHALLEQLARCGADSWRQQNPGERDQILSRRLYALGVAQSEQAAALARVCDAVNGTLNSERGRWLLERHSDGACELELSGTLDDEIVHAVIDRTFVDASGVRWIVDYKTSMPKERESLDAFGFRELGHYRSQLVTYARLMRVFAPQEEVRLALYFPLVDHFIEADYEH